MSQNLKNIKKGYYVGDNPDEYVKKLAKAVTQEDTINRSLFTQFLNLVNDTNSDSVGKSLQNLRTIRKYLEQSPPSKNYALASLLRSLKNYMISNPSEKSAKKFSDIISLLYGNSDIGNIFLNSPTNITGNPFVIDDYVKKVIDNSIPDKNTLQFNPQYPEYLLDRISDNIPIIISKMNQVEDGDEQYRIWLDDYNNSKFDTNDYAKSLNWIGDLGSELREGINRLFPAEGVGGPRKYFSGEELHKEYHKYVIDNLKRVFNTYGDKLNSSNIKNYNQYLDDRNNINYITTEDFERDLNANLPNDFLRQKFLEDIRKVIANGYSFVYGLTNRDKIRYHPLYADIPQTGMRINYDDIINKNDSTLAQLRTDLSNNPFLPKSLLDTGDDTFIDANSLINYLANRKIEDIAKDNSNIIESLIYKRGSEDDIRKYYKDKVPFDNKSDLTVSLYNNDFSNIDPSLYPLIYDYYRKHNYAIYKDLQPILYSNIKDAIIKNTEEANKYLHDRRQVVNNLLKVNQLLANQPNENIARVIEALSSSDLGENELRSKIAKMEGLENMNDEQKEDLASSIESLHRVKKVKENLRAFLNRYNYNNEERQKLFDSDDLLIRNYNKSLDLLENIINNDGNNFFNWRDFSQYYTNQMMKTKTMDEANRLIDNALTSLRITSLAGLDTSNMERFLELLRSSKVAKDDVSNNPDEYLEQTSKMIEQLNKILNMNFDQNQSLQNLQTQINDLNEQDRSKVYDTMKNLMNANFNAFYDNIQTNLTENNHLTETMLKEIANQNNMSFDEIKKLTTNTARALYKSLEKATNEGNQTLSEKLTKDIEKLGINLQTDKKVLENALTSYDNIRLNIERTNKENNDKLEQLAAVQNKLYEDTSNLLSNIKIEPDMSGVTKAIKNNSQEMQQMINKYLTDSKEVIDNSNIRFAAIVNDLQDLSQNTNRSIQEQIQNLGNIIKSSKQEANTKDLLDKFNGLQAEVSAFNTKFEEQTSKIKKYNETMANSIEQRLNTNDKIKKQEFDTLNKAFEDVARSQREQQEIAKSLDGRLKDLYNEARFNRETPISKEERYKSRFEQIFADKDKVRQALLSNTITLTSDEDIKEKYFKEKISQEKLKKALGFLPSDPDLTLSQVEEFLPDNFFYDLKINQNDKNMAPIKIKTTNYDAVNKEATGGISNSLKDKLLKLYIYYKDPKQRTIKKKEYPRDFLNDLAILNVNGSPKEIISRYTAYLKGG